MLPTSLHALKRRRPIAAASHAIGIADELRILLNAGADAPLAAVRHRPCVPANVCRA